MTYTFNYSSQTNDEFIKGYTDLIQERINDGWSGFLCSFMFKPYRPGGSTGGRPGQRGGFKRKGR